MDTPRSILIVEDDLRVAEFLLGVLAGRHDCKTAADAGDALLALQSRAFDLVLLDIGLPDCSGLAVNLYVQKTRPGTPVVVISGNGDASLIERAKENGVYEFLTKPFTITELEDVLERALKGEAGHEV